MFMAEFRVNASWSPNSSGQDLVYFFVGSSKIEVDFSKRGQSPSSDAVMHQYKQGILPFLAGNIQVVPQLNYHLASIYLFSLDN